MGRGGRGPSGHSTTSSHNSGRQNNTSTPTRHSSTSHSSTPVIVTYSDPDPDYYDSPANEIDRAREAAYNALGDLVTLTTTSRDNFSDRVTDINSSVVSALAGYVDNSPIVSDISDDLSVWLNHDTQSKITSYDEAISNAENAKGWV
ncbi:MAG: hypothetical protein J6U54_22185 [Clostridiales bacterium]|nr:hypothetical protein [Clostridiales bacterium]